jgi:hypothetical protein
MKKFTSLTVQMVYVAITGLQLIFVPNMMLSTFGIPPTNEIWIKNLGIIVFILAILYYYIRKTTDMEVVKATIWGRLVAAGGIIVLALTSSMPILILFATFDIATAAWTWFELKK